MRVEFVTNSIFNSRTYIISEGCFNRVCLVDCGDLERIIEQTSDKKIEAVLLTHVHFDHIYGLPSLFDKFPDVLVYTNDWGKIALADERLNMSYYHESRIIIDSPNVKTVREGQKVYGFDVYETPGHNPSCICYANKEMIFTGDAYIPGCKVVTNLPHCDKVLAEASVKRIKKLASDITVYPGHSLLLPY